MQRSRLFGLREVDYELKDRERCRLRQRQRQREGKGSGRQQGSVLKGERAPQRNKSNTPKMISERSAKRPVPVRWTKPEQHSRMTSFECNCIFARVFPLRFGSPFDSLHEKIAKVGSSEEVLLDPEIAHSIICFFGLRPCASDRDSALWTQVFAVCFTDLFV